jgi:hypothetical protein
MAKIARNVGACERLPGWRRQQSLQGKVSGTVVFADGCGARLKDVDGNEYIDYALAWGRVFSVTAIPRWSPRWCRPRRVFISTAKSMSLRSW